MKNQVQLPVGIPSNYRELYTGYKPQLTERADKLGVPVSALLTHLRETGLIEGFDLRRYVPSTFTREDAIKFLGVTESAFRSILRKASRENFKVRHGNRTLPWYEALPNTVNGRVAQDSEAIYWGPDILRLANFMDEHGLLRDRPECSRLVSSFRRRLGGLLAKMVAPVPEAAPVVAEEPIAIDAVVDEPVSEDSFWPRDLPRDSTDLVKMYGDYVFDQVRRVSRIQTEEELAEVTQQVWLDILKSDVLGKFVEAASTKLPRTLTVDEALGYLGVTFTQWTSAMAYHKRKQSFWMPTPVKGTHFSKDSLYLTSDIQTLDESGFLKDNRMAERRKPEVTGRGFKSYLSQAIKNHFKNLLRTRSRRHKERGMDPRAALVSDSSGVFRKVAMIEDGFSWEETLTDDAPVSMEDMIDMATAMKRHGVDPTSEDGMAVLDSMSRGQTLKSAARIQGRNRVAVAAG